MSRGFFLLLDEKKETVILKAAERVIPKALKVAEILKKRVPGLHQVYTISGEVVTDVY